MRVELDIADARRVGLRATACRRSRRPADGGRSTGSSSRCWACSPLLSLWVLGVDLFQVVVHSRVWTGTDGVYIVDQMQYLAWIKSASQHVLASNLFVVQPTPADYFQPAVAISPA